MWKRLVHFNHFEDHSLSRSHSKYFSSSLNVGSSINNFPGNLQFRRIVLKAQNKYKSAKNGEKTKVVENVLKTVRNLSPPGRFLKEHPSNENCWFEIGYNEAKKKVVQAMRLCSTKRVHSKKHSPGSSYPVCEFQRTNDCNNLRRNHFYSLRHEQSILPPFIPMIPEPNRNYNRVFSDERKQLMMESRILSSYDI